MNIRIATIDNLSALAWQLVKPQFPARFSVGPPSFTLAALRSGQADAALVPVAGLPSLAGFASPLGPYGIACEGAVQSVAIFSREPLQEVLAGRRPVYVSEKSRTSRQLLQVLCRMDYGVAAQLAGWPGTARTRLLIGDESMDVRREEQSWPVRIDLGAWWFQHTRLPFVYARWVIRDALDSAVRERLLRWLENSAASAMSTLGVDELATRAVAEGRYHGGLAVARDYYGAIRPRLTLRDLAGLRTFLALQEGLPSWAKSA